MGSGGRNDSNTAQLARIGEKIFLMNSTYIISRKWESNVFGLRSRNDSNTAVFARIGGKKIFDELDVHDVSKVGIKHFWAQETEMILTPLCSLESARKIFLMNSTYIMSTKWE